MTTLVLQCSLKIALSNSGVYLGVGTCEYFFGFGTIVFLALYCFELFVVLADLYFTSLASFTGSYSKDEPNSALFCRN